VTSCQENAINLAAKCLANDGLEKIKAAELDFIKE
jgi:hypothetical protein